MALGRAQGALAWELRGAMSILRLRTRTRTEKPGEARTGELAEASERVREVYDGFTQGFASPDLQDAAALLGAGEETPRTA